MFYAYISPVIVSLFCTSALFTLINFIEKKGK